MPIFTVLHQQLLTRHILQLILKSENKFDFEAGQYINVIHKDKSESPLSIACAPQRSGHIELHLSHPPGNSSAHEILKMLKQDASLEISAPLGNCTPARFHKDLPIIFFVRGTGFAPVKAMLEFMAETGRDQAMHLYWGAAQEDFYMPDKIREWETIFSDFRVTQIIGRSAEQHKLQHQIISDYPDLSGHQLYASGPFEMVRHGLDAFTQAGLQREYFYSDLFA
jgi:CDP-4-dehydro-6-deoxyglucose reductase